MTRNWTTEILRAGYENQGLPARERPAYPPEHAQDAYALATYLRAQPSSLDVTVGVWRAARAARKAARDSEVRAALRAIREAAPTVPSYGADLPTCAVR
jgi:hypothetical protein